VSVLVYLRFVLAQTADRQDFEEDLRRMAELAHRQPGYRWSETDRPIDDPSAYVVVSEWDDVDRVRDWEHEATHVEIQEKWEPLFHEPLVHRRFTPWERPAGSGSPA
jgi:heme-degrading monooxygenase HmoA